MSECFTNGRHNAEAEKTTVAENERTSHGTIELDFEVPEALLGKVCAVAERFNASTVCIERVALNANCDGDGAHASVPKRCVHRCDGAVVLERSFVSTLGF